MSVVVQRSDVAGDGLFAAEDLPVGFKLRYEGVYKKATDCTVAELDYAANVGCGVYIVGCGLASKINDAYCTSYVVAWCVVVKNCSLITEPHIGNDI